MKAVIHRANAQPKRRLSLCGSAEISMEIKYPNNSGWRRREIANRAIVNTLIMTSFTESKFMTLFQSLGLFSFLLHFVFSLFQFCWSWSVRKEAEFSFESDKISFLSNGLSLPILKILLIHWRRRRDTKLTVSLSSLVEILLYLFLAITFNLKTKKDQHQGRRKFKFDHNINVRFRSSPSDSQFSNLSLKYCDFYRLDCPYYHKSENFVDYSAQEWHSRNKIFRIHQGTKCSRSKEQICSFKLYAGNV